MERVHRVLFLLSSQEPPREDPRRNQLFHLSARCSGDMISPTWLGRDAITPQARSEWNRVLGAFEYHPLPTRKVSCSPKLLRDLGAYVSLGLRLSRKNGAYDAIVAYGPYTCSVAGWVLGRLTGAKLVVEVPGPPTDGFIYEPGLQAKLKLRCARLTVPWILRHASALRLYYRWQLDGVPGGPFPPAYVFPDFVPVSLISAPDAADGGCQSQPYILFLGFPFKRKGVDVLIRAFHLISARHPEVCLRIVGYCPDLAPYRAIANGNPHIHFEKPVGHAEAMELMSRCRAFVLPSRAEGVPRVLIEAMAAKKPVISTRVSGIPALVEHERNGLLVDVDDTQALAEQIDRVLSNPSFAQALAVEGHRRVYAELAEHCYVSRFHDMLVDLDRAAPAQTPQPTALA